MTYRADEIQASLQRFLAQLNRERLSHELQLELLSRNDVDTMLDAMFALPEGDRAALIDLIYPLTEGNPFFVEDVLSTLVSSGELVCDDSAWHRKAHEGDLSKIVPVTRSVQDAVQQRTRQLSAEALQLVTLAAVAGRRFDFAVLQKVMQCDEMYLLALLKELMAAQLVIEEAEALLENILPREQQPGNFFERQVARVWGGLALAQGNAVRGLAIAEQLIDSAPGHVQQPVPHLLILKGKAILVLKRLEEAAAAFEEAKVGAEQRQAPSILWRIQCSLGQTYHLLKREDAARLEWSATRNIINALAATIDDSALREHFLRAALASLPQEKPLSPQAISSKLYAGLSRREQGVATLVALGKSNREIAASLVVSERRAEAHVSNILGKLGFTSRAQIAAWAVEKGLVPAH